MSRLKRPCVHPHQQDWDEMERTHVRCYNLDYLKSVKGRAKLRGRLEGGD